MPSIAMSFEDFPATSVILLKTPFGVRIVCSDLSFHMKQRAKH